MDWRYNRTNLQVVTPNFNFPLLTYIDISDNPNLGGNVPSLASSTNLQICYAIRSALTGSIPNFSQQNLRILWLSSNQLTGTIPNFNMPILQQLRLNNNQLTGTIPNFNLPNLAYLYINVNQLTGGIPNFTGMPVLVEFFAAANQLSGNIPNFANMPNLKTISLSVNQLTGSIPDFNLPSLSTLFLRKNQLSGNIPNFSNTSLIAAPPAFTQLWLYDNKFVFGDIEGKTWLNTTDVEYEPQAKIPIVLNGTSLSVNTGSANNVQQFTWYKDDVVVATNQNNTFTPTSSGKYYCKISHNTITTTSDTLRNLILQSDDYNAAILPVELLNFQVTPLSKTAYLTWQTASERNASHFDVQRSRDGKTFEKLGQVKAHGNSATLQSYAFTDETPAVGTYYYRLQQVDFDGTTALSNIVSVEFGSKHKLQVFPNPTKDKLTIVSKSKGEYAIFDMIGHEIRRGGLLNNATDVTVSDLPIGFYVVKVAEESVKFFKN
ncbi:MAG: T9SS type A sorting domain-containing protein [Saprospiraceae bacterium]|nr:T9SS type A sorting domain-containing protein [Saprospiraceae bacterium]